MYKIVELLEKLFSKENKENLVLDSRIEFRLNKKEKILIQKYCILKKTNPSELLRDLAIKEIDTFINSNSENK